MRFTKYLMSIAAAALAFAACQKAEIEVVEPAVEGQPFELTAALNATKTVNQGLKTKWSEADTFNVFHAVAGTTDYITDGKFTITDAATGHASGSVASPLDGSYYDWYTIFPYASAIKTPGARESGYVYVGSRSDKTQTQTGNNSTAHLCGAGAPMYGVQKHLNAAFSPKIIQHQLTSVVKVHVTNNSDVPVAVSSIKFTGTEDIVGSYIVDITGEAPVYTPYKTSYVSATAELAVKDGEALEIGGSADFYLLIKPFTAAASSKLKLAVNGYEKTSTLDGETSFKAGEITTLEFSYDRKIHPVKAGSYAIIAKSGSDYFAVSTAQNASSSRRDRVAVNYAGGETFSTSKKALIWDFAFEGEGYIISNDGQAMTAGKNIIPLDKEGDVVTVADNGDGTYTLTADCGKEGIRLMAMNGSNGFGWYASTTGVNKLYIVPATYVAPVFYKVGIGTTVNGTVSADCTEAEEGQEVSLTITPASGYELDKVSVTTATSAAVTVSNNKFTMPAEDVTVAATFKEQTEGGSTGSGQKVLTFSLSSNPGKWPTSNSSTLTNYIYKLDSVEYTFGLMNVKCNSGYLMLTQTAVLGLPAISGYKLTKAVMKNTSGCSTSVKVGISTSASSASYLTGGDAQTWSKTSSTYTYSLSETAANVVYYVYVTNKNAQITSLELTYDPVK